MYEMFLLRLCIVVFLFGLLGRLIGCWFLRMWRVLVGGVLWFLGFWIFMVLKCFSIIVLSSFVLIIVMRSCSSFLLSLCLSWSRRSMR